MKIKIEPFLIKKGNKVAKAAIEFEKSDGFLAGFLLVGFTICNDPSKDNGGLYVLFPTSIAYKTSSDSNIENPAKNNRIATKPFFFLRPGNDEQLGKLESLILDTYENMITFNNPQSKQ